MHTAYVDQNTPRNCWHLTPKFILMSDVGCGMSMATTGYNELSSTCTIIIYGRKMNNLFHNNSHTPRIVSLIQTDWLNQFSFEFPILYNLPSSQYNISLYLWWIFTIFGVALVDATTAFASQIYKTTNENILFCLT